MIVDRTHQCDGWRERIATCHDEGVLVREADDVAEHVARCAACHAYADELVAIRGWIRSTPSRALPEETLEAIWARTVDREPSARTPRHRSGMTRGLAVAAIVVLSIGASLGLGLRSGDDAGALSAAGGYSDAELDRIDRDLRIAMAHLAGAVASAERVTVEDVLVGEASTVLRHLPLSTQD